MKQLKTCNGSFIYKSIEGESWKITDYKHFKTVNILIWVEHFLAAQGIMKQKKNTHELRWFSPLELECYCYVEINILWSSYPQLIMSDPSAMSQQSDKGGGHIYSGVIGILN